MWDFDFGKALGLVLRTLPFVLLRVLVFFGIGLSYLIAMGVGAALGLAFGTAFSPEPFGGALIGGLIGLGITSIALYLAREYLLYLVKAAHIAVLVALYDGVGVPSGKNQITFGAEFVTRHFATTSVLFGVDQAIKAVLRALFGTINFAASFLPIPGFQGVLRLAEGVVRLSLTYVDEVILAYLIRTRTENPWATAKTGLTLYAQNYGYFLKNALWLTVILWAFTVAIFIVLLGPAAGLVALLPGAFSLWSFAVAALLAWGIKAALLEPLAITCLISVYFKRIEGQRPDPEWEARLDGASRRFRDLGTQAAAFVSPSGRAPGASPGPTPA